MVKSFASVAVAAGLVLWTASEAFAGNYAAAEQAATEFGESLGYLLFGGLAIYFGCKWLDSKK